MQGPVREFRDQVESMETAFEFLISYAGQGVTKGATQTSNDQLREYVDQFDESMEAAFDAAERVPEKHDRFDMEAYHRFLEQLEPEVEEARTTVELLRSQETITSAQVDSMNGMSVFQSVMMKYFFLDELTDDLERGEAVEGGDEVGGEV